MNTNNDFSETQSFDNIEKPDKNQARKIIRAATSALMEKGYNPVSQIVGYILSGDPTYITNYKNARAVICELERDELLEEIVNDYLLNMTQG